MINEILKNDLQCIFDRSFTIKEVLSKLNKKDHTSYRKILHRRIIKDDIDLKLFNENHKNWLNLNKTNLKRKDETPIELWLVENSDCERHHLKRRLIKEKIIDYKCEYCKNVGEWLGKKLSLQLDHKNGINNDNRIGNLRFLCPNCHSQTESFSGKNKKFRWLV